LNITNLNVPKNLIDLLTVKGYNELYPSQQEAIKAIILKGENISSQTIDIAKVPKIGSTLAKKIKKELNS